MKLLKIFFVLFVCVWFLLTESPQKCSALRMCSVRETFTSPLVQGGKDGVTCKCKKGFYGKNCRFKVYQSSVDWRPSNGTALPFNEAQPNVTLKLDAYWHPNGSAVVQWKVDQKNARVLGYRLKLRRVQYSHQGMVHKKWLGVTSLSVNLTTTHSSKPLMTLVYHIPLSNASSYEINLESLPLSGKITSVSVFLDSPYLRTPGYNDSTPSLVNESSLQDILMLNNDQGLEWGPWSRCETHSSCGKGNQLRKRLCEGEKCSGENTQSRPCQLNNCPGRFFHITEVFDDEGPKCYLHGVIVGATGGSVGTLVLVLFIYVLIRQWRMRPKFPRFQVNNLPLAERQFTYGDDVRRPLAASGPTPPKTSSVAQVTKTNEPSSPTQQRLSSVVIDIGKTETVDNGISQIESQSLQPFATKSEKCSTHRSSSVVSKIPGTEFDSQIVNQTKSQPCSSLATEPRTCSPPQVTAPAPHRSSSMVITMEEPSWSGKITNQELPLESTGTSPVTPCLSEPLKPSVKRVHFSPKVTVVSDIGIYYSYDIIIDPDTNQAVLLSEFVQPSLPNASAVRDGSSLTSAGGPGNSHLDLSEVDVDKVEASTQENLTTSDNSFVTLSPSSPLECSRAVMVTIGEGNQAPTGAPS